MSSARIGGGIAILFLVGALALVTIRWWTWHPLVVPSVDVGGGAGADASPPSQAQQVLSARTRLQSDRYTTGGDAFPQLSRGDQTLQFKSGVGQAPEIVDGWRRRRVEDETILQPPRMVVGQTTVPYRELSVLAQPQGRDWRADHNGPLRFGGAWLIFGVGLALALFLFARGRIRIAEGESGESVLRFNAVERANHWMTATAFILMAVTGLIILYGKPVLLPFIGEYALARIAYWSAWLHMASAVPFVVGIAIMAVLWMKQNMPSALDWEWLKRGGGFLNDSPDKPLARRFNAGQKGVFWAVTLGGALALLTGAMLMLPFYFLGYDGMHWAQLLHATIGLLMIAIIIGHIYIGTVGMEGAIDAMWSGRVDRNWAKEHHQLWLQDTEGAGQAAPRPMREHPP